MPVSFFLGNELHTRNQLRILVLRDDAPGTLQPGDKTMTASTSYANRHGHSDIEPVEIVKTVNAKCLEVREMRAGSNLVDLKFSPGGFVGHFHEQEKQAYEITSDPTAATYKIRLNKQGKWMDRYGQRHILSAKPKKFYDFNF